MICFGGVCIPYTAVIPLLLMGVRWVLSKLHQYGLLPGFIADYMNLKQAAHDQNKSSTSSPAANAKPCACEESRDASAQPNTVKALKSEEQFNALLRKDEKFVVKFTANWCGPCKKIHPFYKQKCTEYKAYDFLTIDVDDFDAIASKYSIAMMPTFLILKGDSVIGTCRGSSKPELESFLDSHLR